MIIQNKSKEYWELYLNYKVRPRYASYFGHLPNKGQSVHIDPCTMGHGAYGIMRRTSILATIFCFHIGDVHMTDDVIVYGDVLAHEESRVVRHWNRTPFIRIVLLAFFFSTTLRGLKLWPRGEFRGVDYEFNIILAICVTKVGMLII